MPLLGLSLALLIGLSLGLLGGGGSILTVPVFVYVLRYGVKPAVAMSLAVVGTTSLVGAAGHWRRGNVNLRAALTFAPVAMLGTFAGARLARQVSETAQLTLFATLMLAAAGVMARGAPRAEAPGADRSGGSAPATGLGSQLLVGALGGAVGVLTGLAGIGGGFLIVPALTLLARLPMKQAIGTSLVVIALNAAAGFAGYLGRVELDWAVVAGFTSVAILGVGLGTRLAHHVPPLALRRGFAAFLAVTAGWILVGGGR
ncbi:MAG TPA: sulfite exporter TauE/SafE family protein [Gemmatimonadales bacterium]|nr:sulfite exporter TauE/SafE family protein [Gemmatimonadales bacterium]